jgi:AMP deaminase
MEDELQLSMSQYFERMIRDREHVPTDQEKLLGYSTDFPSVHVIRSGYNTNEETKAAIHKLNRAIELRHKFVSHSVKTPKRYNIDLELERLANHSIEFHGGIFQIKRDNDENVLKCSIEWDEYLTHYTELIKIIEDGPVKSLSYERMKLLELRFKLHLLLNREREKEASVYDPKDFDTVTKVDTHIHLAAAMTEKHLTEFIKTKLREFPDEIVQIGKSGKETLKEVFQREGLDNHGIELTANIIDVHAGDTTFNRFDNFNNKYNPGGSSQLRGIFLKTDNYMNGRYMAELTKELFAKNEAAEFIATEYRLSVYGRKSNEWDALADWIEAHNVRSVSNKWLVQIPRVYSVWRGMNAVKNFGEYLENVFRALFEVTVDPSSRPKLHRVLYEISGFDSVDDESRLEHPMNRENWKIPSEWTQPEDPPYEYYAYYMYANIRALNLLRESRNLPVFAYRPHCGESGREAHLAAAFLLADGIAHGINLAHSMPLQYLYFNAQIGIAVSPLSNNALFLDIKRNPFLLFFQRGLNVSLSTDDPLQFHHTQEPLLEEYSIVARRWKLNETDLSEIARNSVLMSGFNHETKEQWLGPNYWKHGTAGNDIAFSNVPNIRIAFRVSTLESENVFRTQFEHKTLQRSLLHKAETLRYSKLEIRSSGALKLSENEINAMKRIKDVVGLRARYKGYCFVGDSNPFDNSYAAAPGTAPPAAEHYVFRFVDGVAQVFFESHALCSNDVFEQATIKCAECNLSFCDECDRVFHKSPAKRSHSRVGFSPSKAHIEAPVSFAQYEADYRKLVSECGSATLMDFCSNRLELLESLFDMHVLLNKKHEKDEVKRSGSDFYSINLVDTHVHLSSSVDARFFLRFIKEKLGGEPDRVVMIRTDASGKQTPVTLRGIFESAGLSQDMLTLDSLAMRADANTSRHLESLMTKYNPFGFTDLRKVFLKWDNYIKGEYFSEAILSYESDTRRSRDNYFTEPRVSVYGEKPEAWSLFAKWFVGTGLAPLPKVMFLVQIPRLYHAFRRAGAVRSFAQMLSNIFAPLFEVTINPASDPDLFTALQHISGFDSVEEEIKDKFDADLPEPDAWTSPDNPPYAYYLYYMWANIRVLNELRRKRGLNTFALRPHCGESGDAWHLASAFLLADGISHGSNLVSLPSLQVLYYLAQIGISISPTAENALFVPYEKNPFPQFFKRGLNVSLSSDNPLQHHFSNEPLVEEFASAAQMWKLSSIDIAEIARNAVVQSGFRPEQKQQWLGDNYSVPFYCDASKDNLASIRTQYREDAYFQLLTQVLTAK